MLRVQAVLLAAIAATACAAAAGLPLSPSGNAAAAPPRLATACGSDSGITAHALWLTTDDRVRLYEIEAGDGNTGVVLAHQGRSDLCEELPYAKTLVAAGLRVLAFDFRNNGHSAYSTKNALAYRRDFAAAIKQLRSGGARRVFLIGASMGGAAAVQNSGGLPLAGVVSLSGTRLWSGFGINKSLAPSPSAPRSSTSAARATGGRRSKKRARSSATLARATSGASSTEDRCVAGSSCRMRPLPPRHEA